MKKTIILLIMCLACMSSTLWAAEAYVVKSTDGKTLTFYYDDNKASREGTVYDLSQNWRSSSITTVIFDSSFAQARPTSTSFWFSKMENLKNIENIQYLNTSEVTDMSYMFADCNELSELDLRTFDTRNVTNMKYMFSFSGYLSDWGPILYSYSKLKHLNLSSFDTRNVTDMSYMFYCCSALEELDVSSFNTGKVTNMAYMFFNCLKLTTLDVCSFNTSNVTDMTCMFGSLAHYDGYNDDAMDLTTINVSSLNTQNVKSMRGMFYGCEKLTNIDVSHFDTGKVTNMASMFKYCKTLTSLNLSSLNTSNVTNMSEMFSGCSGLSYLNISHFNTSNVTDMSYMFSGCSGLSNLNVSSFNTNNVRIMEGMFKGCSGLSNLNVSSFNTSNVTNMGGMFAYCTNLKSLNLSTFNTSNLGVIREAESRNDYGGFYVRGYGLFEGCKNLTSLSLGNFNTENVEDFSFTFYNCMNLKSIDVSNFNTKNATNMVGMFANCSALTQIDVSNFNTENVLGYGFTYKVSLQGDMLDYYLAAGMFEGCSKIEMLNLGNFDFTKAKEAINLIKGCINLKKLYVSSTITGIINKNKSCNTIVSNYEGNDWYYLNMIDEKFTFSGVGSEYNPCYFGIPDNFELDIDMSGDYFTWMDGYFTLTERTEIANEPYVIKSTDGTTLNFKYDNQLFDDVEGTIYRLNNVTWNNDNSIQSVIFDSSFTQARPKNTSRWFYRLGSLSSIEGIENLNTSEVTDMSYMFNNCYGLKNLDVSRFDTQNVNDMSYMFYNCNHLANLAISEFDTQNVTNMFNMFYNCKGLTNLDVSNFDTQNVTNMGYMFNGCSGLTSLDVSNFDTQNVTNMSSMFNGCSGLTSLDVSNFNLSKISDSWNSIGFQNCSGLTSLKIPTSNDNIPNYACSGVGTETVPCLINQPEGFDFGVDTSGDYFVWKGGYFTLGKQEYEGMMGDVNIDGVVSISDALCIISWLQENSLPVFIEAAADYNEDGSITVSDALAIIRTLLNEEDEPATHIGEAIDLGLPSGLKWASFNVGATSPEEIGGYYAWGETEEKNGSYDESTYNYYHSSFDNLGANISGTNYDVAHIKWGGTWRMPTKNEFDELIKHCSLQYSTLNNVNGITFVGPNGNSIFLPTAGFRRFQGSLGIHNGEKWGYYWTSTQSYYQYEYCAYNLFINYQSYAELQLARGFRTKGLLVRPVTE